MDAEVAVANYAIGHCEREGDGVGDLWGVSSTLWLRGELEGPKIEGFGIMAESRHMLREVRTDQREWRDIFVIAVRHEALNLVASDQAACVRRVIRRGRPAAKNRDDIVEKFQDLLFRRI